MGFPRIVQRKNLPRLELTNAGKISLIAMSRVERSNAPNCAAEPIGTFCAVARIGPYIVFAREMGDGYRMRRVSG